MQDEQAVAEPVPARPRAAGPLHAAAERAPVLFVEPMALAHAPRVALPPEIVARLNREINAGLASAEIKEKYAKLGTTPMVMTPEEFWGFAQGETDKWQQVIERAGIKVD